MQNIPDKVTHVKLQEQHVTRDKDGKVIARPAMIYDPEQGFIHYDATTGKLDMGPGIDEDDSLAADAHWQQLLENLYAKALGSFPDTKGRLEKALALVQEGKVLLGTRPNTYLVSSSHAEKGSYLVGATCPCADAPSQPAGWCKHRLAMALYRQAQAAWHAETPDLPEQQGQPVPATPPAPAYPSDLESALLDRYTTTIQGKKAIRYAGLLLVARQRGLTSLVASWTYNDNELSLATATATFADGSIFTESGDATPGNVTKGIAPHFRRMALTRAKARCLRDALGMDMVALEELGEG